MLFVLFVVAKHMANVLKQKNMLPLESIKKLKATDLIPDKKQSQKLFDFVKKFEKIIFKF